MRPPASQRSSRAQLQTALLVTALLRLPQPRLTRLAQPAAGQQRPSQQHVCQHQQQRR